MSHSAHAHRPRLSLRSAPRTILVAAEINRGADAATVTQRYVGRMSGRRIPQSSRLGDLALAVGLALLALVEIWWPGGFVATGPIEGNKEVLVPTALAMTLPLALRRRWPLATVLVVFGAAALQELLSTPPDGLSGVIAVLVASYSVAAYSEQRSAAAGLVAAILLVLPAASATPRSPWC